METPAQTLARAQSLLDKTKAITKPAAPVTQQQAGTMTTAELSKRLATNPITTPVQPDQIKPVQDVNLPEPTAFNVQSEYVTSAAENVSRYRQTFDTQLQSRRAEIEAERSRLTKERDNMIKDGVEPNLDPFRADLEKTERDRLKVEENYFANQKLTDELDTLLTRGNQLIEEQRALPVNQAVVSGRVNNALRDVSARAGVIEAVMAARNSQISQAYTLIDRSVAAISADRNDQLTYYETLINLNQQDVLKLDKEDERLANEQITLAKSDLERAQATADYIKEKMINPETAQFMAEAGITLLDSPEEINTKLALESGRREVETVKNKLTEAGYEYVPYPAKGQPGVVEYEVNGQKMYFKVRPGSDLDLNLQAQRVSIANANTNRLLSLAKAGDAKSIKALGFDPREVEAESEKLDPTTKRQVSDQLDAGKNLLELTTKYRNLVATYGYENTLVGDQAVAGQYRALRAQLTAAYKDAKSLGSLDQGLLTLVEGIIGEEPTSGFNIFANLTGKRSSRIVSQLDELIDATSKENARSMTRLGIDPTATDFGLLDKSTDDAINAQFGVNTSTQSVFAPGNYFQK